VKKILNAPSSDGLAFTPLIMLDEGDYAPETRWVKWQAIRDLLGSDEKDCIVCPGWELIRASAWTSKNMSDALGLLHSQGWTNIAVHLSTERASCASNPIEFDDPWHGEELCWYNHNCEFVNLFLYQATGYNGNYLWVKDFVDDIAVRFCQGYRGWRIMEFCLFETVAYGTYRNYFANPDTEARNQATAARDYLLSSKKITGIGYGNGLPL
jgi:hypothetical protein